MGGTSLCDICKFGLPDLDPAEGCPIPEELRETQIDLQNSYALPENDLVLGIVECKDFEELVEGGAAS